MVDGVTSLVPAARVGHIGLYRDPKTLEPVEYYCKLPADAENRELLILDPMLATGGSASAAINFIKQRGCHHMRLVNLIAAPEGIARIQKDHPDVDIFVAALDDHLNDHGYIVPGLGDAGDGKDCGLSARRLILCFMPYQACREDPADREAVIHPYYPVSQQAYLRVRQWTENCRKQGIEARMAPDIRVKPIFARLPFLRNGLNTLAYLPEIGSRFHVEMMTTEEDWPVTDELRAPAPPACGSCRRCITTCPGGAITQTGFHPEKCLRFWMLNGRLPPPVIWRNMGNRLLGCDVCQACCPMNHAPGGDTVRISLAGILTGQETATLRTLIGSNYARPGRLLIQGCVMAASLGRKDLLPEISNLLTHPLPTVREAAKNALGSLSSPPF